MANVPQNSGSPFVANDTPDYSPLTDPSVIAQHGLRKMREQNERLMGEAQAFHMGATLAEQDAFQKFQVAQQAPLPPSIHPLAMIPYLANAFGAGMTNNPQLAAQGERALMMGREDVRQRRAEMLQGLSDQYRRAAQEADQAGDLARSLQFNQKAATTLREYEATLSQAERVEKRTAEQQDRDFRSTENRLNRIAQLRMNADDNAVRLKTSTPTNTILNSELDQALAQYKAAAAGYEKTLSMLGSGPAYDQVQQKAAAGLEQLTDRYRQRVSELEVKHGLRAAPVTPAPFVNPFQPQQPGAGALPPIVVPGPGAAVPTSVSAPAPAPVRARVPATVPTVVQQMRARGLDTPEEAISFLKGAAPSGKSVLSVLEQDGVDVEELLFQLFLQDFPKTPPTDRGIPIGRTNVTLARASRKAWARAKEVLERRRRDTAVPPPAPGAFVPAVPDTSMSPSTFSRRMGLAPR